ncbi:MAG: hypothetical protein HQL50_10775 [Magnetococcales bacterium]|nr:hypothetical protein [Magnetococcales bacterium]
MTLPGNEHRVVPKRMLPVEIQLVTGRIVKGILHVDLDERLYDFMNREDPFIVLVNRRKSRLTTIINKHHVVAIREYESLDELDD